MTKREPRPEEVEMDLAIENGRMILEASRSQGWKLVFDEIRAEVDRLRESLCSLSCSPEETVRLRGEIAALRRMILLANPSESRIRDLEQKREDLRKGLDQRHNLASLTRSKKT